MSNVVFHHVARRPHPKAKGHFMAPALYQVPTTSRKWKESGGEVFLDGVNTYSNPTSVGRKTVMTPAGAILQEVDRTSIDFNGRGELIIPASNKRLVEFLRNHELCRGSLANIQSGKRPKFFEHDAEKIFNNKILAIENLAAVVTHIKKLEFDQLVSYAKQFALPIVGPEKMKKLALQQTLILQAQQNPEIFMLPETMEYGALIDEIKAWQRKKVLSYFNGGRGKDRLPEWRWGVLCQPEGEEKVILELGPNSDKFVDFAKFLYENEGVYDRINDAAQAL